jgi:hypothetical protein
MRILIVAGLLDDDRYMYRADLENFEIFPQPFTAPEFIDEVQKIIKALWKREATNIEIPGYERHQRDRFYRWHA